MQESLSFTYNFKSCEDLGVVMCHTDSGLFEDIFLPSRKIVEKKVSGRNNPYFLRVDDEPLSFTLTIYIENWKERNNLREIARWLYQDYYKPLWFESNPHHWYYAIFEGNPKLFHNGINEGYITLNVRTSSPYSFSPIKNENSPLIINGSLTKDFFNEGDLSIRPNMVIAKTGGGGDVSITNDRTGETFTLKDLRNGEIVTVDCTNYFMTSNLEYLGRYLFDNHNNVWLDWLPDHDNEKTSFTFTGDFNCDFTFQYKYLAESNILRPE